MDDARVMAAHVGVDRLQLVDEAVVDEEVERAVDRRRRRITAIVLEPIEQVVGLDGFFRARDEIEHLLTDLGQAQAAQLAGCGDFTHERAGVVVVVMGAGGFGGHRLRCY